MDYQNGKELIQALEVSVVMTAYNREAYISEAIESVIASDFTEWELIIVDDCSGDRTVQIAEAFAQKDSRIRVHVNEKNLGQFSNRNKAVSLAVGKYIITVDSDDKIFPFTVRYLLNSMQEYPEASFGMYYAGAGKNICIQSEEAINEHFFKEPFLTRGPGGTVFKRAFFEKIGGYPVTYGAPGDLYFNLKAAASAVIVLFSKEFMYYRRHEGQEINNEYSYLINNYKYLHDALDFIDLHLTEVQKKWLQKKNKRRFAVNITAFFLKTLNFKKARSAITTAGFSVKDYKEGIFHI